MTITPKNFAITGVGGYIALAALIFGKWRRA